MVKLCLGFYDEIFASTNRRRLDTILRTPIEMCGYCKTGPPKTENADFDSSGNIHAHVKVNVVAAVKHGYKVW